MKRFAIALAISALPFVAMPVVTPAQTTLSPAQIRQLGLDFQAGQWFEYQVDSTEAAGQTMKMSWLDTEVRLGETYQWIEMDATVEGESFIAKMLVNLDASTVDSSIASMVFKIGNEPALEMSGAMLGMGLEQIGVDDTEAWDAEPIIIGEEEVTVPAGTFTATVVESTDDDWRGYIVPDVGLVKAEWPEGTIELLAVGQNATTAITETPISFESLLQGN